MPTPSKTWIDDLPKDRLIAEFSVWSADLMRLADDLGRVDPHVDILHIDVADGHFAPAMLFFPISWPACAKSPRAPSMFT